MQEDYKSFWCDIASILDDLCGTDTIFVGVKAPAKVNWKSPRLGALPKEWWKAMQFPPKTERAMKAFWKKHPGGEVKWEW